MFFGYDSRQAVERLTVRVAVLERVVAELAERAGVQPPARQPLASEEVLRLLGRGETIAAIKQLRVETGFGLAEAKRIIDRIQAGEDL